MEGIMATVKGKKSTGTLSTEMLTGLMKVADISFKGKGEIPRDKVATLARKKMKLQRAQYAEMRKQIRASRFIGKLAASDDVTSENIEEVQALLTGKSAVTSEEFSEFTI